MMIEQLVVYVFLHTHQHAKQILSIDLMTCIVVFVVGCIVGHAIALGAP